MSFKNWLTYTEDVEIYIYGIKVRDIPVPKKLLNNCRKKHSYWGILWCESEVIIYIKNSFREIENYTNSTYDFSNTYSKPFIDIRDDKLRGIKYE